MMSRVVYPVIKAFAYSAAEMQSEQAEEKEESSSNYRHY